MWPASVQILLLKQIHPCRHLRNKVHVHQPPSLRRSACGHPAPPPKGGHCTCAGGSQTGGVRHSYPVPTPWSTAAQNPPPPVLPPPGECPWKVHLSSLCPPALPHPGGGFGGDLRITLPSVSSSPAWLLCLKPRAPPTERHASSLHLPNSQPYPSEAITFTSISCSSALHLRVSKE